MCMYMYMHAYMYIDVHMCVCVRTYTASMLDARCPRRMDRRRAWDCQLRCAVAQLEKAFSLSHMPVCECMHVYLQPTTFHV